MMGTIAPPAARALARLHEAGFEAWLVGGCVRDMLLGCAPKDYDLATSARPEETKAVFQGETVLETGIRHGTVTVLLEGMPLEITTYRVDGAYSDARHPDGVTFADNLRADAARRDFTINAMFYPQLGVKLCSMAGGGVQKIYMVFLREPSRRDRSGSDLFHLRDGFEIKMNFDRNVSCFIFVNALMHDDFFD